MKHKIKKLDISLDSIFKLADRCRENGDVMGALRWVDKADRLFGIREDFDFIELLADVYEIAGITDSALRYWFLALDCCNEDELTDIYESLAVCFGVKGDKQTSDYYYEKMLRRMGWSRPEIESYLSGEPQEEQSPKLFHRVFPPEKADYAEQIGKGLDFLRRGDFEKAEKEFDAVHPASKDGKRAGNFAALSEIMQGRASDAISRVQTLLSQDEDSLELLVTLGTAYRANGEPEKGVPIAKELAKRDGLSNEEMLKVSSLLCELGLHSDVFEYARRMEKQFAYDGNVLFMEGIAAINCGMEEEAKEVFDRLLTLYPDAAVVEYYLKAAEEGSISSASYLYRVPPEERQLREEKLEELTELTVSDLRNRYSAEMDEIEELFDWCFDEMDGQDLRLQAIAVTLALNADAREYLEDLLLDYQVNDVIKTEVVRNLCIRNKECSLRIVVHNTYQIVTLPTLHIGRKAHKKFMEGYALCMSHFGLRAEGLTELIPPIAGVLYGSLAEKNLLDEVDSAETVAASICSLCGLHEENDALRMLCLIVGANYDKVFRFLEVYRGSEK